VPNIERELMFGAKPRARAHVCSQTSSGSSCFEPNLERELMFGAKRRAGAHVWSQTSSRSSCLAPNLEREHSRAQSRKVPGTVLSKSQVSKSIVFIVFLHVRRCSRAKSDFSLFSFQFKLLAQPTF